MTEASATLAETLPGRLHRRTLMALVLLGLAAAVPILMAPAGRGAGASIDRCGIPPELTSLGAPLPHAAQRLNAGQPLTIVALGSSSTEGVGATSPEFSYPSRLAAVLQARFPEVAIRVVNRGVSGELSPQMVARIERDVLPEHPDLVIWQLGTNSVLRDIDPAAEVEGARRGIGPRQRAGAVARLRDLQCAPAAPVQTRNTEGGR